MYKLIEFLRRIYVAVLFVVFEAIAIGYYAHSSNYTQAKLLTRSNQVVGGVNGIFADIRSYFTLGRENERLLERVAVLEEELAFYRRSAADSVRTDLLHDMGEKPYELTVARVISNSINKNRNFIVLDRGERDGVEKGMGVLSPEGAMVGYVAASSDRHAVAVSILNTSFNASGKLAGDDYFGSIYWAGDDRYHVRMKELSKYARVTEGEEVVSSGFSQYFPADVLRATTTFPPAHCGANTLSVQKQKALPFLQIPTGKCSASGAFFPKKKTALWMVFSAPGP